MPFSGVTERITTRWGHGKCAVSLVNPNRHAIGTVGEGGASGRPLPRNDSSGDFFEMAEAQVLDHLRLDRRDVLVGLVGTKRRAYDGAGSTAALGLTHELGDGLRDIVGIRGVLALEDRYEVLEHGVGDLADLTVGLRDFGAGARLNACQQNSPVKSRPALHDLHHE